MPISITVTPAASNKLDRLRAVVRDNFDQSLSEVASLRWLRAKAELESVNATGWLSQCCGHAPDREEGADCGCQDVDVDLTFRLAPVVKGGATRQVIITGDVTLADGEFQAPYWSWQSEFLASVEALVGKGLSERQEVEYHIERAV